MAKMKNSIDLSQLISEMQRSQIIDEKKLKDFILSFGKDVKLSAPLALIELGLIEDEKIFEQNFINDIRAWIKDFENSVRSKLFISCLERFREHGNTEQTMNVLGLMLAPTIFCDNNNEIAKEHAIALEKSMKEELTDEEYLIWQNAIVDFYFNTLKREMIVSSFHLIPQICITIQSLYLSPWRELGIESFKKLLREPKVLGQQSLLIEDCKEKYLPQNKVFVLAPKYKDLILEPNPYYEKQKNGSPYNIFVLAKSGDVYPINKIKYMY